MDKPLKDRLERVAEEHGVKPAVLIRDAVRFKLDLWEREGVHLTQKKAA